MKALVSASGNHKIFKLFRIIIKVIFAHVRCIAKSETSPCITDFSVKVLACFSKDRNHQSAYAVVIVKALQNDNILQVIIFTKKPIMVLTHVKINVAKLRPENMAIYETLTLLKVQS